MDMEQRVKEIALTHLKNVRPTGRSNLRAECPFHKSKHSGRSFSISLETGAWICFNEQECGERGSFWDLLKGLGFRDQEVRDLTQGLREATQVPHHLKVKAEINREPVFLPNFILGTWEGLPQDLLDQGFREEVLREYEVCFDKERDRIIFPVRDYMGRLACVSGRAVEKWRSPRYKVYDANKETGELKGLVENYFPDNRLHLYGFHLVYPDRFHKEDRNCPPLVITEGYKSTIWVRQSLPSHPVGLQGSSLTVNQQRLLSRLAGPYYVMLDLEPGKQDWDQQGRCAAISIARELSKSGKALVCQYPPGKPVRTSPDDLTPEEIELAIKKAKTPTELILERK